MYSTPNENAGPILLICAEKDAAFYFKWTAKNGGVWAQNTDMNIWA
jgi:hypothetical protein